MERVALGLLAAREHSRGELARKLAARGFAGDKIEGTLDALASAGLIDEGRLAEAYVSERLNKGFGPLRIRQELRAKGLPEELIAPHLRLDQEDLLERIAAAHDRRFGREAAPNASERARRGRFLEYRGFPAEAITRFLRGSQQD
jgi:regulatory protein